MSSRLPSRGSRRRRAAGRVRIALAATLALLAFGGALAAAAPARAELYSPRQDWMRASTAGLFLHWGMFTSPMQSGVTDYKQYCANWEKAVTDGGWDPHYWVHEADKLHASYLVLTTFHSRLGYARPWPSKIPGSCSTKRDILGETIAAAKEDGLKVILYMTDDPQWHAEKGFETLDSKAFSDYAGHQVDLTTRDGFGEFSYDNFFEVMQRYPDLGGFWIDNDNAYWEQHHLYEQIRQQRPDYLLSNNNEDTPIMDTVSNEQKTGMTPDYDYPAALYTPLPRLTEADYKLPTEGSWWYDGKDHEVDTGLSVGRYITNAGSSVKSLMAETAMINGRFPPQQEAFNDFMAGYLPSIWDSIHDTQGGGYMYGGMQPGPLNDGAFGVVTVKNPGGTDQIPPGAPTPDTARTQFVHVTTKPETQDYVRIRDNGYKVVRVSDERTGEPLPFNQSGGYLTIEGIANWDPYDTVFKVQTAAQQGYYPQDSLSASASAADPASPASNLTDGSFLDYWDNDGKMPVSATLDLGDVKPVSFLAINQREWSPTYNRETFGRQEDSARIKDYRVYVSEDGVDWGEPVKAGTLESARGVRFIDFGEQRARYVKLEVLSNWSDPALSTYHNQLKVDELRVGYRYVTNPRNPLPGEAEARSSDLTGSARVTKCDACSGGAAVSGLGGGAANTVTLHGIHVDQAGDYRLEVYSTADADRSFAVSVNGADPKTLPVDASNVPGRTALGVPLQAGDNSITFSSDDADGPALDRVAIRALPPASYVPKTTFDVTPAQVDVPSGRQSIHVTGTFRLDDVDPVDDVKVEPVAPAGWSVAGAPATAARLEPGRTLGGDWTVTTPDDNGAGSVDVPVRVTYTMYGRSYSAERTVHVQVLPPGWAFIREAESSLNPLSGKAGPGSCKGCSGGQKVRFIGNGAGNFITFNDVDVSRAGEYQLFIDSTVSGTRSFFVSVDGGPGIEVPVTGTTWDVPTTSTVPITLAAGSNTIRIYNDDDNTPDLDRIRIAEPGS